MAERDPAWYRHLLIYAAFGYVELVWKKLAELAWVPAVNAPNGLVAPSDAWMVPDASREELLAIAAALAAIAGDGSSGVCFLVDPEFAHAFLDVRNASGSKGPEWVTNPPIERLKAIAPTELSWAKVLDEIAKSLQTKLNDRAVSSRDGTPGLVLELLALAHQKDLIDQRRARELAKLLYVPAQQLAPDGTIAAPACRVRDLWLSRAAPLAGVPEQVDRLLPRLASGLSPRTNALVERLAASIPSPGLVMQVLQQLPNPTPHTAAWVFRVWQAWQERISAKAEDAPSRAEVAEAVACLRLLGKGADEWRPISDYFPDGFGERARSLEVSLTELFGARQPDLREYGSTFTREHYEKLLKACKETEKQTDFVPDGNDVESAIERISHSSVECRAELIADFATYLVGVLEAVRYRDGPRECERIRGCLRSRPWLSAIDRESLALPEEVVRIDNEQVAAVLRDCVAVLAWPSDSTRRDRFKKSLEQLTKDGAIKLGSSHSLNEDGQKRVVRRLRDLAREIPPDKDKETRSGWRRLVHTIGALLDNGWLGTAAVETLRVHLDLTHFTVEGKSSSQNAWIVCEKEEQRKKFTEIFPRGVTIIRESERLVRRGLAGVTQGFIAADATGSAPGAEASAVANPLDDAWFAGSYLRALGQIATGVPASSDAKPARLSRPEQDHVAHAYQTLLQASSSGVQFQATDSVILTHAGTLQARTTRVFAGRDPRVRNVLTEQAPDQLLAASVLEEFSGDNQANLLRMLGVEADDQTQAAQRITEHRSVDGVRGPHAVTPEDQPFLSKAIMQLCADDLGPETTDDKLAKCRIERVAKIEQRLTFVPTGHTSLKQIGHWLKLASAPLLYLTDSGAEDLDLALLGLRDAEELKRREEARREFENREAAFRKELELAKKQVAKWARDQQEDVIGYYRQISGDNRFREEDNRAREQGKSVSERWATFIRERRRIELLIKKHTLDVGYGVETIIRELLQNVDDAYHGAPLAAATEAWVEFHCRGSALIVQHAGRRFNAALVAGKPGEPPNDVLQICSSGGSEKSEQYQIGRFGLGFKSVFAVTFEPVVLSHPYYFRIRHVLVPDWEEPQQHMLNEMDWRKWVTTPIETRFILESSRAIPEHEQRMRLLHEKLAKGAELRATDLLFLRRLRRANAYVAGATRTVSRRLSDPHPVDLPVPKELTGSLDSTEIRLLETKQEGRTTEFVAFLVLTARCSASVPTGTGMRTEELEYAAAFPWNIEAMCFAAFPQAVPRLLYLFLPTKEKTGFPFLVHGQFLTNLGRTDIDGSPECNRTLAVATARLVQEILRSSFDRWRDDPTRLRSIYHVIPLPRESFWDSDWLDCVRNVFTKMLEQDERVVLTTSDELAKPGECRLGSAFLHQFSGNLRRKLGSKLSWPSLVHPDIETVIERSQGSRGYVKRLSIQELAQSLFPTGLSRAEVIRRATAVFRFLFDHESAGDLALQTEQDSLLKRLSSLPCFPDSSGGVDRPLDLRWPQPGTTFDPRARFADIDAVAGADTKFREWLHRNLNWQPPPIASTETPVELDFQYAFEVLVTEEQREVLWAHNLRRIGAWWSELSDAERQRIEDRYSLAGDTCYLILGLPDVPLSQRREQIQRALRERTPDHPQALFRVLCLANISQSGRRFSEGIQFLRRFDEEFQGFERIWQFAERADSQDVVDAIIRDVLSAAARDRSLPDHTFYWRHLYDFVKIRQLLTERQFIEGFWEVAERHSTELPRYLHTGVIPGDRLPHRGLGESLSSQAFFICREAFRLGLVTNPQARSCCYYPNRHMRRLVDDLFGPHYTEWANFEHHETLSDRLHRDVTKFTKSKDFGDAFDIPLMHLAMEETSFHVVPGLATRDNPGSVQDVLSES